MTETTHGEMYERAYFEVQDILDEVLGAEEEDGSGGGIAADVALLADRLKAAEAENQRLHSWQGLMSILDEHYPGDHGNRIWALLHAVDEERSSRQAWAAEATRLSWIHEFHGAICLSDEFHPRVCACISDDQASTLAASGMLPSGRPAFTRPVCAVHREVKLS